MLQAAGCGPEYCYSCAVVLLQLLLLFFVFHSFSLSVFTRISLSSINNNRIGNRAHGAGKEKRRNDYCSTTG